MSEQVFLNRYKALRQIGEGGMSRVFLGRQLDQSRDVAIKVLLPQLAAQPKIREHFRREIHILAHFRHAHAIGYYDADPDGAPPCLVMEYVRGTELTHLLAQRQRLRPERAGRLLGQLCDVLHAAHEQGITHRDLKPSNILVMFPDSPVEKIKLMDFGLAQMSSMFYLAPAEMVNQRQPTASGTPDYISPEQIRGNNVDRRSDIYSLGVLLYELLTGQRPFKANSIDDLLSAHLEDQPPSFRELGLGNEIAPALERVVMDCLTKYPEDRIPTCEELALRFEKSLGRKIWTPTKPVPAATPPDDGKPAVIFHPRPGSGVRPALGSGVRPALTSSLRAGLGAGTYPATQGTAALAQATPPVAVADRHAITHQLSVSMIESMAMLKLKGFIHDLGGHIIESVPGMIRVKVLDEQPQSGGFLGLFGGRKQSIPAIDMEMRMEKRDAGHLAITLILRSPSGQFNREGKSRCEKIFLDLNAYLMGSR